MKSCSYCDREMKHVMPAKVSISKAHDGERYYCLRCMDLYLIGVQHGRFHEAAVHGTVPSEGSSQEPPVSKPETEVVIEVYGGVAEATTIPPGVKVKIIDNDEGGSVHEYNSEEFIRLDREEDEDQDLGEDGRGNSIW